MSGHDDSAGRSALGILLAMVHTAWADGKLAVEELRLIRQEIADQGLDSDEAAIVETALLAPPSAQAVAEYFDADDARMAGLAACYLVALADRELVGAEVEALNELARAMGLETEQAEEVHRFALQQLLHVSRERWGEATLLETMIADL